jgi:hypothetical protein
LIPSTEKRKRRKNKEKKKTAFIIKPLASSPFLGSAQNSECVK